MANPTSSQKYGYDYHYANGAHANFIALVHQLFPIEAVVFGFRKHFFEHQQVATEMIEKIHALKYWFEQQDEVTNPERNKTFCNDL